MVTKAKTKTPEVKLTGTQLAFETVIKINTSFIRPNPYQPGSRLNPPADIIERIAASIKEFGLIQTPVVRRHYETYEMGDGWIRLCGYQWLAKNDLKGDWQDIPVVIRELTDQQMADLVMEANTVRNDLSPIDLAKFYKKYLEDFKVTQVELARAHNVSQGEIANTIRLLDLPDDIQGKIISHEISETHGRSLLQLSANPKQMQKMADRVIDQKLSVKDLDNEIEREVWNKARPLYSESYRDNKNPVFDLADCAKCEHRQMLKYIYSSEKKAMCLDASCWNKKQKEAKTAGWQKQIDKLAKQGVTKIYTNSELQGSQFAGSNIERLNDPECGKCERRGGREDYNGQLEVVCVDMKCYHQKEKALKAVETQQRDEREQKEQAAVDAVFAEADIRQVSVLMASVECLLRENENGQPKEIFRVLGFPASDDNRDRSLKQVLAMAKSKFPGEAMYKLLPRLCFEIYRNRNGYYDDTVKKVLQSFNAGVPEHAVTDTDEGKEYRLMLRSTRKFKDITAPSAQAACEEAGWLMGDCWVREFTKSDATKGLRGGGWANVTPRDLKQERVLIPEGVRLAQDVPKEECLKCLLGTEDHTIEFSFPDAKGAFRQVCVKDYQAYMKVKA
jgi:ParB family chromosome partitioning protein